MRAPETPVLTSTRRTATTTASHQFSGRCSAHKGRSMCMSSCKAVTPARTLPRSSTRSAREPPVPTSMPSHIASCCHKLLKSGCQSMQSISPSPKFRPVLDPEFLPASLWNRAYRALAKDSGGGALAIALERGDGSVSVFPTAILPLEGANRQVNQQVNQRYIERLLKFLLWQRGGWRVTISGELAGEPAGARRIAEYLRGVYSPGGARAFDHNFSQRIYGRPLEIESAALDAAPAPRETAAALGRHLDGFRIGFDLG